MDLGAEQIVFRDGPGLQHIPTAIQEPGNRTNELLKAMPDEWFTNNDDYVDVFYTLFENKDYQEYKGASSL